VNGCFPLSVPSNAQDMYYEAVRLISADHHPGGNQIRKQSVMTSPTANSAHAVSCIGLPHRTRQFQHQRPRALVFARALII